MEAVGCALDQREEALASRRNVRAVLNVVRRPETLRSGVVPLVEKRFESLQHESLILFLDCLRHFILLRSTLQTRLAADPSAFRSNEESAGLAMRRRALLGQEHRDVP